MQVLIMKMNILNISILKVVKKSADYTITNQFDVYFLMLYRTMKKS